MKIARYLLTLFIGTAFGFCLNRIANSGIISEIAMMIASILILVTLGILVLLFEKNRRHTIKKSKNISKELEKHHKDVNNQLIEVNKNLKNITDEIGLKIKYISLKTHSRIELFNMAKKHIKNAKKNITVLNSFIVEVEPIKANNRAEIKAQKDYYEEFIKQVKSNKELKYNRYVQVRKEYENSPSSEAINKSVINHAYKKHYYEMLQLQEKEPSRITLHPIKPKRLMTFVLIDDYKLLWQINDPLEDNKMRMTGYFIIEDKHQQLIPIFIDYINEVKAATKESINKNDINLD